MLFKMVVSSTSISLPTFQGTKIVTTPWLPDSPLAITGTACPSIRASAAQAVRILVEASKSICKSFLRTSSLI